MIRYKILKINAKKLVDLCALEDVIQWGEVTPHFSLDVSNEELVKQVVTDTTPMDNCALYEQLRLYLKLGKRKSEDVLDERLMYTLITMDFSGIYDMPEELYGKPSTQRPWYIEKARLLIEGGFLLKTENQVKHMMAFDKNDNMSRSCKITYIDHSIMSDMNERLTVGIQFDKIKLPLSKYYAYRGLYLSTSNPVSVRLTEETVVVVSDAGSEYKRGTDIFTAEACDDSADGRKKYTFVTQRNIDEKISKPYDGQGFICEDYAKQINIDLGLCGATSFQVRMPFAKGMLHTVNYHGFLAEFDENYKRDEPYEIIDCFGIKRDLKKAKIILTESMFKCSKWLLASVEAGKDPMEYYFKQLEQYEHKLFVANTDIPYGKSKVVRLSYQMLNTLALSDEQFDTLIKKHLEHIKNPDEYLKLCENYRTDEECTDDMAVWKRALFKYPEIRGCDYVKSQLENTQRSLLGQLPDGKITVHGQMRFLARDLPFMLVQLIRNEEVRNNMDRFKLWSYRFFMPQGAEGNNSLGLCYEKWYGFFRSPHLSRNEQCLLKPYLPSEDDETKAQGFYYSRNVQKTYDLFCKYFGHLTGVVIVGNQALVPLALGGADFDGDLVEVILDETVNQAIATGVYEVTGKYDEWARSLPYVKVPSNDADNVAVPKYVPFEVINNTFSNKIGMISNAAIGIGQEQYGNPAAFSANGEGQVTCEMCTILTGLEIDAAKHGKHPDLSMIENNRYECWFLDFNKKYKKMKKQRNFHMNTLKAKPVKDGDVLEWELSSPNQESVIYYPQIVGGTHINKLPIIFMENVKLPSLARSKREVKALFSIAKEEQSSLMYQSIMEQYTRYVEIYKSILSFYDKIGDAIKKHNMDEVNKANLLAQTYEADTIEAVSADITSIVNILKKSVKSSNDITALIARMNNAAWHLIPETEKKACLRNEILQTVELLEDSFWEVVCYQHHQGYKILYYIIKSLELDIVVEEAKTEFKEKAEDTAKELVERICNMPPEDIVEDWNMQGKSKMLEDALCFVKEKILSVEGDISLKVRLLFNLTSGVNERRLFWSCFKWDEIQLAITEKKGEIYVR